jgi:hypothetical protein
MIALLMNPRRMAVLLAGGIFVAASSLAQAQPTRDPTEPPAAAAMPGTAAATSALAGDKGGAAVVVRDGKPYLVVGTRLYAQGQKLGQARIERISETEVWLREGGVIRKLPRFAGIQRRPAMTASTPSTVTPANCLPKAASSSRKAQRTNSCAGAPS